MASTDAKAVPIKNAAYRVTFPILDADGDLVTGAATLDSEVSKDGGTFADATNEATEIATASGMYFLDLTAAEMNADTVAVIVKTGTAGAKTTVIVMYPEPRGLRDLTFPNVSGRGIDVDASGGVEVGTNLDKTGYALTVAEEDAIVDKMWDEGRTAHVADGSMGQTMQIVRSSTAQAGAAGTITLDAAASATDDFYNDLVVQIIGGTGIGQARLVSDYVGSTKVASVTPNWATNPDATSVFLLRPAGREDLALWLGVAPSALNSGAVQADVQRWLNAVVNALISGRVDVDLRAVQGNVDGPPRLDRAARGIVLGTVTTGATTTSIPTSSLVPAASATDQFKGRILVFDKDTATVALRGQATDITASTSGGTLTVTALTVAPASGDTFVIV